MGEDRPFNRGDKSLQDATHNHKIAIALMNDSGKLEKPATNFSFLTIASNKRDYLEEVKNAETIYHMVMKGLLAIVLKKA
ncbi:unnamed protein product [Prunus armeniaca]